MTKHMEQINHKRTRYVLKHTVHKGQWTFINHLAQLHFTQEDWSCFFLSCALGSWTNQRSL